MRITPLEPAGPAVASPGGSTTVRVLAGQLTAVPVGELLRATVARAGPAEAVLTVNGQALTVRPPAGLQPGAAVIVRVPPGAAPGTLELVGRADTPAAGPPTPSSQSAGTGSVPTRGPQATPAGGSPQAAGGGGVTPVRVLAGQLASVPVGQPLRAMVTRVTPDEAVLTVNGQALTVRPSAGLQPGAVVLVRTPAGAVTSSLELVGRAATPTAEAAGSTAPSVSSGPVRPPQIAMVDVLPASGPVSATGAAAPPNAGWAPAGGADTPAANPTSPPPTSPSPGAVSTPTRPPATPAGVPLQVLVDGRPDVAVSTAPLTPGGRYVLQVEQTPTGLVLRPPPDSPSLATDVAAAVLRSSQPADLGAAIKPLLDELAALQREQPGPVGRAAASVREAVQSFLPPGDRPPNPAELQNLVENGGLLYEAKLARQSPDPSGDGSGGGPSPQAGHSGAARALTAGGPDLKESLLRLLQAAQEIGTAASLPAARTTLDGVEAQQAANVAAQAQGTPYVLQVPFPDRGEWRTLNLAVEPERNGRSGSGGGDGFRLLMHVPLTDLGETWVDAGLAGNRLRAVMYMDSPAARDRVRAELPGLRDHLMADGFGEVLLDVRPVDALPTRRRQQAAAMHAGRPAAVSVLDVRA